MTDMLIIGGKLHSIGPRLVFDTAASIFLI